MRNLITTFKKAAGRITVCCLFVIVAIFAQANSVDAVQVLKKTTNMIGDPVVANNRVTFTVSPTARYTQHAKYLDPDMKIPDDILRTKAKTRITGFAYACPGYYTSRIYSDMQGQNLLGYIQVYVSEADIKNSKCDKIKLPSGTPPPTPEKPDPPVTITPPPPKSDTHPVPGFEGITSKPTETKPKIKPEEPDPPTFSESCIKEWSKHTGKTNFTKFEKIPTNETVTNEMELCCPVEKKSDSAVGTLGKVIYIHSLNSDMYVNHVIPGTVNSGWGCGQMAVGYTISDTYCPIGLDYNASTKTCDQVFVEGDIGNWDPDPSKYEDFTTNDDHSDFGDYSSGGTDPPDGGDGEDPPPGDGESCEENPDQEHCPPPCYCEKMGDWGYMCCIFDCPGWDDFLGFLEDDIVGTAKAPPVPDLPAPKIPNIFDVLNNVDERNPPKPTGKEDPNLGKSSFDAVDIKKEAPEIEFEEDPTGGFNIVNPLDTLPEGSDAPRPEKELESLPYPDGSGKNLDGDGSIPKPEGSGSDDKINYPVNPGGKAEYPTTGGKAEYPTTEEVIKYPGT